LRKLPPLGYPRIIACGNYAPRKLPRAISWPCSELPLAGRAQGIAAESPQDLRRQIRGLAAESPVFLSAYADKKMRPDIHSSFFILYSLRFLDFLDGL
jgi:hypothetical protein